MRFVNAALVLVFVVVAACAQQEAPKVIKGGILNGKAVSLPKPAYPAEAKAAGIEGFVKVDIVIDETGTVTSATAVKDEDDTGDLSTETVDARSALRAAAEQAALEARFPPTLLSGQPVKVSGTIVYNFAVSGAKIIDGGVLNNKAVELPQPPYPPAAKAVRATGMVAVQVIVDENGNVIQATAGSGHPLLRSAAVAAAREARFAPTLLDGKPVKISGVLTYNFVLPQNQ